MKRVKIFFNIHVDLTTLKRLSGTTALQLIIQQFCIRNLISWIFKKIFYEVLSIIFFIPTSDFVTLNMNPRN